MEFVQLNFISENLIFNKFFGSYLLKLVMFQLNFVHDILPT